MKKLLVVMFALALGMSVAVANTVIVNGVATETPTQLPPAGQPSEKAPAINELDEVYIDFDDMDAPSNFSDAFPLTNEYTDMGVTFSGQGEVLNEGGNFGISGYTSPNFLAFNTGAGVSGPETLEFDPPVSMVSILGGHGSAGFVQMEAFDADGGFLGDIGINGTSTLQELLISSDDQIASVVLSFSGSVCCFDDLTFDPDTTPAPVEFNLYGTTTVVPPAGGNVVYDVELVSNIGASYNNVQYWTMVTLPNGQDFGPLFTHTFNLTPFMDVFVVGVSQAIPALAPSGVYTHIGYVGYMQGPHLEDSFEFEKTGTATDGVQGWGTSFPASKASLR